MNKLVWNGKQILKRVERQSKDIVYKVGDVIETTAKQLVPVKTGALQRSIKNTGNGVEATEDYAGSVELGTAKKAAQPYLRPAIERFSKADLDRIV